MEQASASPWGRHLALQLWCPHPLLGCLASNPSSAPNFSLLLKHILGGRRALVFALLAPLWELWIELWAPWFDLPQSSYCGYLGSTQEDEISMLLCLLNKYLKNIILKVSGTVGTGRICIIPSSQVAPGLLVFGTMSQKPLTYWIYKCSETCLSISTLTLLAWDFNSVLAICMLSNSHQWTTELLENNIELLYTQYQILG